MMDVASDGHQFVAVGDAADRILTSPDGFDWTNRNPVNSAPLRTVTWTGSEFIAAGNAGTILTSPDGVTWTPNFSDLSSTVNGVAGNGRRSVAVTDSGAILASGIAPKVQYVSATLNPLDLPVHPAPLTTGDPLAQWSVVSTGATSQLWDVTWAGKGFVAAGNGNTLLTSTDGITWTTHLVSNGTNYFGISSNDSVAVAVGSNGAIASSADLTNWTKRVSPTAARLYSVKWTGLQFVAAGDNGTIVTSPDGETWTLQPAAGGYTFHHGLWDGHQLVMSTVDGIAVSTDGINWTRPFNFSSTDKMFDIATKGSTYVAIGSMLGRVYTSPDGITWTPHSTSANFGLSGITWSGNQFLAVGNDAILNSPDGVTWQSRANSASVPLLAEIAGHDGTLVIVTQGGNIIINKKLPQAMAPEILFAPGAAGSTPQILLQTPDRDVRIYFTQDGSLPTPKAPQYSGPFSPTHSGLIKARAFKDGLTPSETASAQFNINEQKSP